MASKTPSHTAYTVREGGEGKKGYWIEVGAAWTNKDDSLTVKLDALPVSGELVIRKREPKPQA